MLKRLRKSLLPPDGHPFDMTVREHPRARRARLKVLPPGRVEAVVPRGFGGRRLQRLIDQHRDWIVHTLHEVRREWAAASEPPGELDLVAVAEIWRVVADAAERGEAREVGGGVLALRGPDPDGRREALRRWVLRKGRRHLEPWLDAVAGETGLAYSGLTIRTQRSRWGSCSARGRINLNGALLFLPPRLVRYVLIHELCHTRHLNHSSAYWRLVGTFQPDFRLVEKELRGAIGRVPLWLRYP